MGKEATPRDIDSALAELQDEIDAVIDAGEDNDIVLATFLLYVELRRKLLRKSLGAP